MATDQEIEQKIVKRTIKVVLDAGYNVWVSDGCEIVLRRSRDADEIFRVLMTTGQDDLFLRIGRTPAGWIRFIYGNGADVLADHTTNLEDLLKPVESYAESLAG